MRRASGLQPDRLDAIPVIVWKNGAFRQAETTQSPCPFGRSQRAVFLRYYVKERRGHDTRNRRVGLASCSRRLVFREGHFTGPKCRGLVFPEGALTDPHAQRGYRRVGNVGFGWTIFQLRYGGFSHVSAASEEEPRRETVGSDSHNAPQAWCSRKGTTPDPTSRGLVFPEGTLQTEMPTEATDVLESSVFKLFLGVV